MTQESPYLEFLPILILDDEVEITKALERDLRNLSQIETFTHPHEALERLQTQPFGCIISDLQMPEMSGLEFLKRTFVLQPQCSRILLTAYADLAHSTESVNRAKLHQLLTKPWERDELRESVESQLRVNLLSRENEALRRLALMDGLTGVANHRYFWDRLEAEFSRAKRYGRPLSLILADVDDFKKYNDKHGHRHGDEVLRSVAQSLDKIKRSSDLVARYGGEEFAVILPEVTKSVALDIARRHLEVTEQTTGISLSFGVASFPENALTSTELVEVADKALYQAKASGKHRVVGA
jgi:diguanylate cyclase (GGDEF)-like protein